MPVTPTYPGVYIEELSSGVRTITGVATSITAFIGRTLRGPVSEPTLINNFGGFERIFGGLDVEYPMGYSVRDFYQNGGSQALIVRLFSDPVEFSKKAAEAVLKAVNDAAAAAGATLDSVKTAARNKANEYKDEPGKTAADTVAKAVETAAGAAEATVDSLKVAAQAAVDTLKASKATSKAKLSLPVDPTAIEAAKAVLKAVNDEAAKEGATPATVATAARNKANEYKDEPGKTAADTVAKAVETAAGAAGATVDSLKAAAQAAVDQQNQQNQNLVLEAANPGTWGNNLEITVDYDGIDSEVAKRYKLKATDLFNIAITDGAGTLETIRNVSVVEGTRRLDRVLKEESQLLRVPETEQKKPILSSFRPSVTPKDDKGQPQPIKVNSQDNGLDSLLLEPPDFVGREKDKTGLYALEKADLFNLLCIPPDVRDGDTDNEVYKKALLYCFKRRAMLIVDPPAAWGANKDTAAATAKAKLADLGLTTEEARNAALYFPRVIQADPLREGQSDTFVPCGIIAGIMAKTDVNRGVWKAPAGIDAGLLGIQGLQVELSNDENGVLNPLGINCLRNFPPVYGRVVWGARTLRGADQLADEYKYLPVRRMLLFLEESLYRGTQWVVFEPNDEPLWAQIRLNIGAFMNGLFRQGAFQGKSPKEAYFVKCDSETTTQYDIDRGIVNIIVGFAPLKPAEFVILKFQQITKQTAA
jgi:phage tail sheath protein FI